MGDHFIAQILGSRQHGKVLKGHNNRAPAEAGCSIYYIVSYSSNEAWLVYRTSTTLLNFSIVSSAASYP